MVRNGIYLGLEMKDVNLQLLWVKHHKILQNLINNNQ